MTAALTRKMALGSLRPCFEGHVQNPLVVDDRPRNRGVRSHGIQQGSSLTGVDSLSLSWAASLTSHVTFFPVPENASALLWGYDSATNTLGNAVTFVPVAGALGTTIAVAPTDSPGYAVEVSWPGQYLLDGQSGGQCGRVKRLVFAR